MWLRPMKGEPVRLLADNWDQWTRGFLLRTAYGFDAVV